MVDGIKCRTQQFWQKCSKLLLCTEINAHSFSTKITITLHQYDFRWTDNAANTVIKFDISLRTHVNCDILFQLCTVLWLAGWTDSADLKNNHAENDPIAKEEESQTVRIVVYSLLGIGQCK